MLSVQGETAGLCPRARQSETRIKSYLLNLVYGAGNLGKIWYNYVSPKD
jgi:hypothetical protein